MAYLLIDTPSIARRHWEVFRKEPPPGDTLAVAGAFAERIVQAIDSLQGRFGQRPHTLCAFDAQAPTWRHEKYEGYKRFRERPPHDYEVSLDLLFDALDEHGCAGHIEAMEADDLLASAAKAAKGHNPKETVHVVSADKDLLALIGVGATVFNHAQRENMTAEGVEKRFGITPKQILDYLALVGDTADNIPGVPRIGAKKAARLLGQYGDLGTILEAKDADDRDVTTVQAHSETARLSRELTALRADLYRTNPIPAQPWPGKEAINIFNGASTT